MPQSLSEDNQNPDVRAIIKEELSEYFDTLYTRLSTEITGATGRTLKEARKEIDKQVTQLKSELTPAQQPETQSEAAVAATVGDDINSQITALKQQLENQKKNFAEALVKEQQAREAAEVARTQEKLKSDRLSAESQLKAKLADKVVDADTLMMLMERQGLLQFEDGKLVTTVPGKFTPLGEPLKTDPAEYAAEFLKDTRYQYLIPPRPGSGTGAVPPRNEQTPTSTNPYLNENTSASDLVALMKGDPGKEAEIMKALG